MGSKIGKGEGNGEVRGGEGAAPPATPHTTSLHLSIVNTTQLESNKTTTVFIHAVHPDDTLANYSLQKVRIVAPCVVDAYNA